MIFAENEAVGNLVRTLAVDCFLVTRVGTLCGVVIVLVTKVFSVRVIVVLLLIFFLGAW